MVNYKLTVQYDGTLFAGFQIQKNSDIITVQGELQKILSMIFDREVQIICAGRTDSGVHALEQVVSFRAEREMDVLNLKRALNGLLGGAVTVSSIEIMPPRFHARFTARARKYVYVLDNSPDPHALLKNRAYWFPHPLDVDKMKQTAKMFMGRHDFTRFSKNFKDVEKPVRDLDKAEILTAEDCYSLLFNSHSRTQNYTGETSPRNPSPLHYVSQILIPGRNLIFFYFEGKSFLHSMVRIMVGHLIKVGQGTISQDDIKNMLKPGSKVKSNAVNVPGYGLYLVGVGYEGEAEGG